MTFIEMIRTFLGQPPVGLEYLEYSGALAILVIFFAMMANVINGFVKMFNGR